MDEFYKYILSERNKPQYKMYVVVYIKFRQNYFMKFEVKKITFSLHLSTCFAASFLCATNLCPRESKKHFIG